MSWILDITLRVPEACLWVPCGAILAGVVLCGGGYLVQKRKGQSAKGQDDVV